jgi:hypothetical protein
MSTTEINEERLYPSIVKYPKDPPSASELERLEKEEKEKSEIKK